MKKYMKIGISLSTLGAFAGVASFVAVSILGNNATKYVFDGQTFNSKTEALNYAQNNSIKEYSTDEKATFIWTNPNGSKSESDNMNDYKLMAANSIEEENYYTSKTIKADENTGEIDANEIAKLDTANGGNKTISIYQANGDTIETTVADAANSYFSAHQLYEFNGIYFQSKQDIETYLLSSEYAKSNINLGEQFRLSSPTNSSNLSSSFGLDASSADNLSSSMSYASETLSNFILQNTVKLIRVVDENGNIKYYQDSKENMDKINSDLTSNSENLNSTVPYQKIYSSKNKSVYITDNEYDNSYNNWVNNSNLSAKEKEDKIIPNDIIGPYTINTDQDISDFGNPSSWKKVDAGENYIPKEAITSKRTEAFITSWESFFGTSKSSMNEVTKGTMQQMFVPFVDSNAIIENITNEFIANILKDSRGEEILNYMVKLHNKIIKTNRMNSFYWIPMMYTAVMNTAIYGGYSSTVIAAIKTYFTNFCNELTKYMFNKLGVEWESDPNTFEPIPIKPIQGNYDFFVDPADPTNKDKYFSIAKVFGITDNNTDLSIDPTSYAVKIQNQYPALATILIAVSRRDSSIVSADLTTWDEKKYAYNRAIKNDYDRSNADAPLNAQRDSYIDACVKRIQVATGNANTNTNTSSVRLNNQVGEPYSEVNASNYATKYLPTRSERTKTNSKYSFNTFQIGTQENEDGTTSNVYVNPILNTQKEIDTFKGFDRYEMQTLVDTAVGVGGYYTTNDDIRGYLVTRDPIFLEQFVKGLSFSTISSIIEWDGYWESDTSENRIFSKLLEQEYYRKKQILDTTTQKMYNMFFYVDIITEYYHALKAYCDGKFQNVGDAINAMSDFNPIKKLFKNDLIIDLESKESDDPAAYGVNKSFAVLNGLDVNKYNDYSFSDEYTYSSYTYNELREVATHIVTDFKRVKSNYYARINPELTKDNILNYLESFTMSREEWDKWIDSYHTDRLFDLKTDVFNNGKIDNDYLYLPTKLTTGYTEEELLEPITTDGSNSQRLTSDNLETTWLSPTEEGGSFHNIKKTDSNGKPINFDARKAQDRAETIMSMGKMLCNPLYMYSSSASDLRTNNTSSSIQTRTSGNFEYWIDPDSSNDDIPSDVGLSLALVNFDKKNGGNAFNDINSDDFKAILPSIVQYFGLNSRDIVFLIEMAGTPSYLDTMNAGGFNEKTLAMQELINSSNSLESELTNIYKVNSAELFSSTEDQINSMTSVYDKALLKEYQNKPELLAQDKDTMATVSKVQHTIARLTGVILSESSEVRATRSKEFWAYQDRRNQEEEQAKLNNTYDGISSTYNNSSLVVQDFETGASIEENVLGDTFKMGLFLESSAMNSSKIHTTISFDATQTVAHEPTVFFNAAKNFPLILKKIYEQSKEEVENGVKSKVDNGIIANDSIMQNNNGSLLEINYNTKKMSEVDKLAIEKLYSWIMDNVNLSDLESNTNFGQTYQSLSNTLTDWLGDSAGFTAKFSGLYKVMPRLFDNMNPHTSEIIDHTNSRFSYKGGSIKEINNHNYRTFYNYNDSDTISGYESIMSGSTSSELNVKVDPNNTLVALDDANGKYDDEDKYSVEDFQLMENSINGNAVSKLGNNESSNGGIIQQTLGNQATTILSPRLVTNSEIYVRQESASTAYYIGDEDDRQKAKENFSGYGISTTDNKVGFDTKEVFNAFYANNDSESKIIDPYADRVESNNNYKWDLYDVIETKTDRNGKKYYDEGAFVNRLLVSQYTFSTLSNAENEHNEKQFDLSMIPYAGYDLGNVGINTSNVGVQYYLPYSTSDTFNNALSDEVFKNLMSTNGYRFDKNNYKVNLTGLDDISKENLTLKDSNIETQTVYSSELAMPIGAWHAKFDSTGSLFDVKNNFSKSTRISTASLNSSSTTSFERRIQEYKDTTRPFYARQGTNYEFGRRIADWYDLYSMSSNANDEGVSKLIPVAKIENNMYGISSEGSRRKRGSIAYSGNNGKNEYHGYDWLRKDGDNSYFGIHNHAIKTKNSRPESILSSGKESWFCADFKLPYNSNSHVVMGHYSEWSTKKEYIDKDMENYVNRLYSYDSNGTKKKTFYEYNKLPGILKDSIKLRCEGLGRDPNDFYWTVNKFNAGVIGGDRYKGHAIISYFDKDNSDANFYRSSRNSKIYFLPSDSDNLRPRSSYRVVRSENTSSSMLSNNSFGQLNSSIRYRNSGDSSTSRTGMRREIINLGWNNDEISSRANESKKRKSVHFEDGSIPGSDDSMNSKKTIISSDVNQEKLNDKQLELDRESERKKSVGSEKVKKATKSRKVNNVATSSGFDTPQTNVDKPANPSPSPTPPSSPSPSPTPPSPTPPSPTPPSSPSPSPTPPSSPSPSTIPSSISSEIDTDISTESIKFNFKNKAKIMEVLGKVMKALGSVMKVLDAVMAAAAFIMMIVELTKIHKSYWYYEYTTPDGIKYVYDAGGKMSSSYNAVQNVGGRNITINSAQLLSPIQLTKPFNKDGYYYNGKIYNDISDIVNAYIKDINNSGSKLLDNLKGTIYNRFSYSYTFSSQALNLANGENNTSFKDPDTSDYIFDSRVEVLQDVMNSLENFAVQRQNSGTFNALLSSKYSSQISRSYSFNGISTTDAQAAEHVYSNNVLTNIRPIFYAIQPQFDVEKESFTTFNPAEYKPDGIYDPLTGTVVHYERNDDIVFLFNRDATIKASGHENDGTFVNGAYVNITQNSYAITNETEAINDSISKLRVAFINSISGLIEQTKKVIYNNEYINGDGRYSSYADYSSVAIGNPQTVYKVNANDGNILYFNSLDKARQYVQTNIYKLHVNTEEIITNISYTFNGKLYKSYEELKEYVYDNIVEISN